MQTDSNDIADKIIQFLLEEVIEDETELDVEDNLLTEVGVDSLGMMRLIGFIEHQFTVKVSPAAFTINNFKNVATISHFVENLIKEQLA